MFSFRLDVFLFTVLQFIWIINTIVNNDMYIMFLVPNICLDNSDSCFT